MTIMSPGWRAEISSNVLMGFGINCPAPPLAEPFSCADALTGMTMTAVTANATLSSHVLGLLVFFILLIFRLFCHYFCIGPTGVLSQDLVGAEATISPAIHRYQHTICAASGG